MMTTTRGRRPLAPARPDQASAITIELLRDILVAARSVYDFVIADTPGLHGRGDRDDRRELDLVMVGTLDSLSLKNTKLGLETLGPGMDYDPRKIQLVLNRADTRVGISQHDVVAVLGASRMSSFLRPRDPALGERGHPDHPLGPSRTRPRRSTTLPAVHLVPSGSDPVEAAVAASGRGQSRSLFRLRRK